MREFPEDPDIKGCQESWKSGWNMKRKTRILFNATTGILEELIILK